ncbi:hypothetical protein [Corynebacterium belfantii]|uniref:Uncharacterized protein n=1 Tax=Corynebacterium belfantii TaxID=2014537 RepID=A0ABS0LDP7_9CORY|nr:hypothetical protein [Corynebacterium belfantii]QBZ30463.1 hypothetical protein E4653_12275 [Corynebacterium diphtheriae subsp. lausannense]MBG9259647.1 hypothetical protein [Corynebacterium belfantii]MBG9266255.1 hypothetical protein [Corynebacterium belfantii]MBG9299830.1 hypothetical protein [Corynebacterium belfantii]MBG9308224.1 hypothetical protein [Corynebacterium belfantii]
MAQGKRNLTVRIHTDVLDRGRYVALGLGEVAFEPVLLHRFVACVDNRRQSHAREEFFHEFRAGAPRPIRGAHDDVVAVAAQNHLDVVEVDEDVDPAPRCGASL